MKQCWILCQRLFILNMQSDYKPWPSYLVVMQSIYGTFSSLSPWLRMRYMNIIKAYLRPRSAMLTTLQQSVEHQMEGTYQCQCWKCVPLQECQDSLWVACNKLQFSTPLRISDFYRLQSILLFNFSGHLVRWPGCLSWHIMVVYHVGGMMYQRLHVRDRYTVLKRHNRLLANYRQECPRHVLTRDYLHFQSHESLLPVMLRNQAGG